LIGSVPAHPIIDRALNELRPTETFGVDKAAAGPEFLGRVLRDYPDAKIFVLSENGLDETPYEATEVVDLTRAFLSDRHEFLHHLFDD